MKKGEGMSVEQKVKIGISNRGKRRSLICREAMSKRMLGTRLSKETRRKMSIARTGKSWKLSPEVRRKMSERMKGITPKSMSPEGKLRMRLSRMGGKHWNWKGGVSSVRVQIRKCLETTEWRKSVFKRDNYTCVLCKKRGRILHADHFPISFADIFYRNNIKTLEDAIKCKTFWDIANGRTLCKPCHDKTPNYGRPRKSLIEKYTDLCKTLSS